MTTDKLIVFCENLEKYHSTRCKRYDDASGYTRSRIEEIRTNDAKREEMDSKFYHELKKVVRKYQKIKQLVNQAEYAGENSYTGEAEWILTDSVYQKIREILEDGNDD